MRRVEPEHHDPYRKRRKSKDAVVCMECGVVNHQGRYYWGVPPLTHERAGSCPACLRIRDRYPAGTLRLVGLPRELRGEIVGLIGNVAAEERVEHPLERLIDVGDDDDDALVVTTTGTHLARRLAGALRRRFHSGLKIDYLQGHSLVRVEWAAAPSV